LVSPGFSLWSFGFNPGGLHLWFVVEEVALEWVSVLVSSAFPS
jgi:hypothetical protein